MSISLAFFRKKNYNGGMENLLRYLETSYTAYQAVENAKTLLLGHGFVPLKEREEWALSAGGKYFVERNGSALIAFTVGSGKGFKIVASHTDSPCLKLKENPVTLSEPFKRLNAEPYGGGIWYSFFDRNLKLAGRLVREENGCLRAENYVSDFSVVIPSLAIHMQRDVNEKFAPNPQIDLLPLLGMDDVEFSALLKDPVSFDLYAVCAEPPFTSGDGGEFVSSPRVDNLTSVYGSLEALLAGDCEAGVNVAACLDGEEIGSRTFQGAGSDFLKNTLKRIEAALCKKGADWERTAANSFLISLDNAHSLHPNHPEKCDLTNRAVMGGGVVIKGHAGGAYTTDALSSSVVKTIFKRAGVKYQTFFNRSDMRSGSTLGAISLGQAGILSADLGLAQLAMHSAVETFAASDYAELRRGLEAFYRSAIKIDGETVEIG